MASVSNNHSEPSSEGEVTESNDSQQNQPITNNNNEDSNSAQQAEDRKSFSVRVYNIPNEPAIKADIKSNLFHKFTRFGKVTSDFWNLIPGADKCEIVVTFDRPSSAAEAAEKMPILNLLGHSLNVGLISEFSKEIEVFHTQRIKKKICRHIHISGSEKQLQKRDVHEFFFGCGRIIQLEIHQRSSSTSVSIQFETFKSACSALRVARIKNLGLKPVKKVDYDTSLPSSVLLISSLTVLPSNINLCNFLGLEIDPMYHIYDPNNGSALIFFPFVRHAISAMSNLNTKIVNYRFFEVDFANSYTELDFLIHLDKSLIKQHMKFIQQIGFKITNKFDVVFSSQKKKSHNSETYSRRNDQSRTHSRSSSTSSCTSRHDSPPDDDYGNYMSDSKRRAKALEQLEEEYFSDDDAVSQNSQYSFSSELEQEKDNKSSDSSGELETSLTDATQQPIQLKDPLHFFIIEDEDDLELKRITAEFQKTCKFIDEIVSRRRESKIEELSQKDFSQEENKAYRANVAPYQSITDEIMQRFKLVDDKIEAGTEN